LTRTVRLLVTTAVGALALMFGGTAFAAYNPSLLVAGTSHGLNGAGPVVIGVGQGENDDATGVVTIYSPLRYGVTLTQAPGTQLGQVSAVVRVGALGGTRANVEGTLRADNPANYLTNPCSPGLHEAVWLVEASLLGNPLRIPMYVDRVTTGAEAAFASARIRICLASPYVPPPQGAQAGASLLVAAFSVAGVFRNPGAQGSYAWQGQFVPYTPGTATPNAANAAQSMSVTRLPVRFGVRTRKVRRGKRRFARVTACVTEAGQPVRGINVNILSGRSARSVRARVARGRTNARGCLTRLIRLRRRTTFFRASTTVPARDVTSTGCRPTLAPRCTSVSLAPAFNLLTNTVRVRR
jgi:hypothetical protein